MTTSDAFIEDTVFPGSRAAAAADGLFRSV